MEQSLVGLWGVIVANIAILDIGLKIIALIIIPNNRKPSSATAWLLAIFFIPIIGVVLFVLLGSSKLANPRKAKQDKITNLVKKQSAHMKLLSKADIPDWFRSISELNTNLGALPMTGAKSFKLIDEYDKSLSAMVADIKKAKKNISFEFYIASYDQTTAELFGELAMAEKRGVKVRVLYDHLASLMLPGYKDMKIFLNQNNIEHYPMLPVRLFRSRYFQRPDLRNHRKLLVIDGEVGYTGSQNLIDRTYNKSKNIKRGLMWQELMVKLSGPIINNLEVVFANDWYAETDQQLFKNIDFKEKYRANKTDPICQIVPSGPGYSTENNLKLFNSLMYNAKDTIIITSPYFVPDESMLKAICTAAQRGLKVVLFVSEIGDQFFVYHAQRSYYQTLMKAGVRIYMFKSPYVLHAKHLTIDNEVAVIGSSNMDIRSLELNQEISLLVYGKRFVSGMRKVEKMYFKNSKELKLATWNKRPYHQKVVDNLARLTSGLQ